MSQIAFKSGTFLRLWSLTQKPLSCFLENTTVLQRTPAVLEGDKRKEDKSEALRSHRCICVPRQVSPGRLTKWLPTSLGCQGRGEPPSPLLFQLAFRPSTQGEPLCADLRSGARLHTAVCLTWCRGSACHPHGGLPSRPDHTNGSIMCII